MPAPGNPTAREPKAAQKRPEEDLDLEPLTEEKRGSSAKPNKPAQPPAQPLAKPSGATKHVKSVDARWKESVRPASAAPPSTVGGVLEPLEKTMKGPLDSLIESEARESSPFDASMASPSLMVSGANKFTFRRFIRRLFRRDKSKVVTVKAADPRQVKLVLFSWGVAIFALLAGLVIFRFMSGRDAVDIRRDAEVAMDKRDYAGAIKCFDEFLANPEYSKTDQADQIRMLRVLAELRLESQKAGASGDWTPAFQVAQERVKSLPKNPPFDLVKSVRDGLAQIAEGLAKQTQAKPDKPSVDRLQAITNTIESDTFAKVPRTEMIDNIDRILKQCKQEVEGQQGIEEAVDEIGKAVAGNDLPKAYAAYRNAVQLYPERLEQPELIAAMKQVSAAQRKAVKTAQQSLSVARTERPSDLLAAVPLAVQPVRGELPNAKDELRFVVDRGTVYGLSAATGKVLWRRFVAQDPKVPAVTAVPIVEPSGRDAVLCDPSHQEVLRVKGLSGELVWRLDVARPIVAQPVRAGSSLLLLTRDQRLLIIDLATGEASRYLHLPQAGRVPPLVDAAHGLIYLVAEQSNLYVLAQDSQGNVACRQVLHLGHETGSIVAAPAVIGDSLLVPVNDSPSEATVRVLSIAASQQEEPLQAVQRINIRGSIDTPPAVSGDGAIIVTAGGGIVAIEHDTSESKAPFRVVARMEPALEDNAVRFAAADGRLLWVTGRQLTRYAVQKDEGQISVQATSDQGAKFLEAPAIAGGTMFSAVERPGLPGVTVSAVDLTKNEPVWQTWLAAPLAASPKLGSISGKLTAVTASGGMFRLPPAKLRSGTAPVEPILCVEAARLAKPISSLLVLPDERFAVSSGADTTPIAIYDPQVDEKRFRWLVSPQDLAAAPAAFAGGVLCACVNGQVFLLDPMAGQDMMAKPYSISLPDVNRWDWKTPQVVDDKSAVLCDGDRRVIAIRISGGRSPALTEAAVAPLSKAALVSPVAVLGKSAYVADADGNLLSYALPALSPGKSQPLGGHCPVGPASRRPTGVVGGGQEPTDGDRQPAGSGLAGGFELRSAGRRTVQFRGRHLSIVAKRHRMAALGDRWQRARQGRRRLSAGQRPVGDRHTRHCRRAGREPAGSKKP